jgi:hypothetical protein
VFLVSHFEYWRYALEIYENVPAPYENHEVVGKERVVSEFKIAFVGGFHAKLGCEKSSNVFLPKQRQIFKHSENQTTFSSLRLNTHILAILV